MHNLTLEAAACRLAGLFPFPSIGERLAPRVKPILESANIFVPPVVYSRFVIIVLLLPVPLEVFSLGFQPVQGAMLVGSLVVIQLAPVLIPVARMRSRSRAVDQELPFFLMALTVLSREETPTLEGAIKRVSELGKDVFPAFANESSVLERNLAFLAASAPSIVEKSFAAHPSRALRDAVHGFQTTIETGREVQGYVEQETKRYVELLGDTWKAFAESVGSLAEVAFLLLALFPVGLEMIAAAIPGFASSEMLLAFLGLLGVFAVVLILVIDAIQPKMYNQTPSSIHLALVAASWLAATALYYWKVAPLTAALLIPILASSVSTLRARRHHSRIKRGEEEVSLLLHDLAEQSKAGVSLPEALSRVTDDSAGFKAIGEPLASFHQSIRLGRSPTGALRNVSHESWLVRLAFGMLSLAFGAGAGFEQLEMLSSFFKRVSDSRRNVSRSILPFAAIGVAVPGISAASLVLLRGFSQAGASFLPQFGQVSQNYVLLSISATSVLTGAILSKLFAQTVRYVVAVPLLLLSTLVSLLLLGFA